MFSLEAMTGLKIHKDWSNHARNSFYATNLPWLFAAAILLQVQSIILPQDFGSLNAS